MTIHRTHRRMAVITSIGVLLLSLLPALPAAADSTAQPLPFSQSWTDAGLITTDKDWSGVPGITGYRGDNLTATPGTDPQTVLVDNLVLDVMANQTDPATLAAGGVAEFALPDPVVALKGSTTARAPYLTLALDTTGKSAVNVSYDLRDIDASSNDAFQQLALQYRVGGSGTYTNLPAGYVADATTGPGLATLVTPVSVTLPAAADDQPEVDVRVITTDAPGQDEWVGVDDISVTATDIVQDVAPTVQAATPSDGATDVGLGSDLSVTFSEPVDVTGDWTTIACSVSGTHPVSVSGGPTTFTLDPTADFASDEACAWTIIGKQVSDQDTIDPPDTMGADQVVEFTTETVKGDTPPTVDAGGPYGVTEGGSVALAAVGSDPDGDALTYAWDLDGDGSFETAGATATFSAGSLHAPSTATVRVQVTDPDGLVATDAADVNVMWAFHGFRPPLVGDGTDVANAGSTVVVKFSLSGNQGRNLFKSRYPASTAFTCGGQPPSDASEPAVAVSPLRYDPLRDEYVFEWKTDKSWAGTCRSFVLGLRDGSTHTFSIRLT
jgi:hypothetical protein